MFLPIRTDAPLYHAPIATVGIIAANVLVFIWMLGADGSDIVPLILHHGQWAPWQWVTSVFLHAGIFHLVGNMIFLWVFGLVVEGKIGWLRFLAVYGAITVATGAFEQTIMLGSDGGSLGASGVIYGLMAIAFLWAPENEVECVWLVIRFVRYYHTPIRTLVGFYLGLQVFLALLGGFAIASAMLHLIGVAAGLPIGVMMLRRGMVECEGWDWFSIRERDGVPPRIVERHAVAARAEAARARRAAIPPEPAAVRFAAGLDAGDLDGALSVHDSCHEKERRSLPLQQRLRLVASLAAENRVEDARPVIAGILANEPHRPDMGLLEARFLLAEGRPSKAAEILRAIEGHLGSERLRRAHADLSAEIATKLSGDVLEFDD